MGFESCSSLSWQWLGSWIVKSPCCRLARPFPPCKTQHPRPSGIPFITGMMTTSIDSNCVWLCVCVDLIFACVCTCLLLHIVGRAWQSLWGEYYAAGSQVCECVYVCACTVCVCVPQPQSRACGMTDDCTLLTLNEPGDKTHTPIQQMFHTTKAIHHYQWWDRCDPDINFSLMGVPPRAVCKWYILCLKGNQPK